MTERMTATGEPEGATGAAEKVVGETKPSRAQRSRLERAAMRRRKRMVQIHRILTLVFGTWALLQGATGIIMASGDQIAAFTHRGIYDHGDGDVGVAAAVAGARAAIPDAAFPASIGLPAANHGVYRVAMVTDPDTFAQRNAYIDPATGEANAVRDPTEGLRPWASRWHHYLLQDPSSTVLGVAPDQLVGWMGVGTIVTLLSGLWLWFWPRTRRWKLGVRLRRGRYVRNIDFHRTAGVVITGFLLVMLVTGLNISFGATLRGVWYGVTPGADDGPRADGFRSTVPPPTSSVPNGEDVEPLSLDDQVVGALATVSNSEAVSVRGASGPDGAVRVSLSHGWDPARGPEGQGGNTTVFLDQYSGEVLRIDQPEQKSASGQAYEYWAFPTHRGTFGGLPTRLLWLVASLGPLLLAASGLTTYGIRIGKRRRRRRAVRRALPDLDRTAANSVAAHAVPREISPGDVLAAQGGRSDSFFVIVKGHVDVTRQVGSEARNLKTLTAGDHFGEIGLLRGGPRTATVEAKTDGEVLVLTRRGFDRLLEESQTTRDRLEGFSDARLAEQGDQER